jgi:hypothetical protein
MAMILLKLFKDGEILKWLMHLAMFSFTGGVWLVDRLNNFIISEYLKKIAYI